MREETNDKWVKDPGLEGIPFSSDDEGIDYPLQAKVLVQNSSQEYNIDTLNDDYLDLSEIYVVSFTYILGNWKGFLSTVRPDGRYYEVTHDRAKNQYYVDTYVKIKQKIFRG